jgi:hypothetical protein
VTRRVALPNVQKEGGTSQGTCLAWVRGRGFHVAGWYMAILLAPLVLTALLLPFGPWDWLTTPQLYLGTTSQLTPWTAVYNAIRISVQSDFLFRPTSAALVGVEYSLFGGYFWAFYIIKWLVHLGCVCLVVAILRRLRVDKLSRWVVAALLLFHPSASVFMLFAVDHYVALGFLVLLYFLAAKSSGDASAGLLDTSQWSAGSLVAFSVISILLVGTKEVAFAIAFVVIALMILRSERRLRAGLVLAPLLACAGFAAYRVGVAASHRLADAVPWSQQLRVLLGHGLRLFPPSPGHVLVALLAVVGALGAIVALRNRRVHPGRWDAVGVTTVAAAVTLLFVSYGQTQPYPRYVIPAIFMLAIPLGLGFSALRGRWASVAKALLVVAVPLLAMGDLWSQALAYQQQFRAEIDTLSELREESDKRTLAVELSAGEWNRTVQLYFGIYGPRYYDETPLDVRRLDAVLDDEAVRSVAVLADLRSVPSIARRLRVGGSWCLSSAALPSTRDLGFFERVAAGFASFSCAIGSTRPPMYDVGAPHLSEESEFVILRADRCAGQSSAPSLSADRRTLLVLGAGQTLVEPLVVETSKPCLAIPFLDGEIEVTRGEVVVSLKYNGDSDIWNAALRAPARSSALELPAVVLLDTSSEGLELVLLAPSQEGTTILFEGTGIGCESVPVEYFGPARRLGSILP